MIGNIDAKTAVEFVRRWHYSGSATPGTHRFGWFADDGTLLGVSIYNNGNRAMQAGVFGPEYASHVQHHHRLALHPDAPKCSASQFIAACNRELAKRDVWAVVTYADRDQHHTGTIYRATNAIYTGVQSRGNVYFTDEEGHHRTMQGLARIGKWAERLAWARSQPGWHEHRSGGRERYVYLLGTAKQRRSRPPFLWPDLPYDWIEGLT